MGECIDCNEFVTNPVCIDCVENEMEVWLLETRPNLVNGLHQKTDEINLNMGDSHCILCKETMSVCTFCYREHILQWVKNYPELVPQFKTYFNLKYFF